MESLILTRERMGAFNRSPCRWCGDTTGLSPPPPPPPPAVNGAIYRDSPNQTLLLALNCAPKVIFETQWDIHDYVMTWRLLCIKRPLWRDFVGHRSRPPMDSTRKEPLNLYVFMFLDWTTCCWNCHCFETPWRSCDDIVMFHILFCNFWPTCSKPSTIKFLWIRIV